MSSVQQPQIEQIRVKYHTGVFTWPRKSALLITAAAGVTPLVLSLLVALNVLPWPSSAMYACIGAGAGVLLADVIVISVLRHKRRKALLPKHEFWRSCILEGKAMWQDRLEMLNDKRHTKTFIPFLEKRALAGALVRSGNNITAHLFDWEEQRNELKTFYAALEGRYQLINEPVDDSASTSESEND